MAILYLLAFYAAVAAGAASAVFAVLALIRRDAKFGRRFWGILAAICAGLSIMLSMVYSTG